MNEVPAPHVLVIDDDKALTTLIERILRDDDYEVNAINSPSQLTSFLESGASPEYFDLVLLDLQMPNGSGVELYRWLRGCPQTADTPVIVLSGISDITTRVKLLDMGADDYIVKPFSIDDLLTQITIHIKVGKMRRAKQAAEARVEIQARHLAAINEITHQAAVHLNIDRMVIEVAKGVTQLFGVRVCKVYLYEPEKEQLILSTSFPPQTEATQIIPDLVRHVHEVHKSIVEDHNLAVPILRDDVLLGILLVLGPSITTDTIQSLEILAVQLTTAITNSYLFQDIQERNQQLIAIARENKRLLQIEQRQRQQTELLHQMAQIISSSLNIKEVLAAAMDSIRAIFQVEMGSIILRDKDTGQLVFAVSLDNSPTLAHTRIPADAGIVGQVMQEARPIIVTDAQNHPRFFPALDKLTGHVTRSILCVPLIAQDTVFGAIQLINKKEGNFTKMDLTMLSSVSTSIAIAIDNAELYQKQTQLLDQLQESQGQLVRSEKMAGIGRLAAALAHEINNPLQAIHSCLQLLTHFDLDQEKQAQYAQMADEEVERLVDIVTRILDFSRAPTTSFQQTNINKIVNQVMRLASKHISHHKWDVEQILSSDIVAVYTMPDQLSQVFLSLILNAFDAMPELGKLTISTHMDGNWVEVTFQDTGRGMSREVKDRIFEPFFSTKEGASGLGLTISYGIVERHGGTILVESELNQGSTFVVRLPSVSLQTSAELNNIPHS
jgi:signal transduction histidine kinase/DNA-binding response OmpR family regulator